MWVLLLMYRNPHNQTPLLEVSFPLRLNQHDQVCTKNSTTPKQIHFSMLVFFGARGKMVRFPELLVFDKIVYINKLRTFNKCHTTKVWVWKCLAICATCCCPLIIPAKDPKQCCGEHLITAKSSWLERETRKVGDQEGETKPVCVKVGCV